MFRRLWRIAAPVVAIASFGVASAGRANTLAQLEAGYNASDSTTYIIQGDKLFTNFGYGPTGEMPTAGSVNVSGVTVAGNYGILIQGGFTDTYDPSDPLAGASDALITYDVTVLDPRYRITDAHLVSDISGFGKGSGTITETFLPDNPFPSDPLLHPPYLSNIDFNNVAFQQQDSWTWGLPGYTTLHVQKDIILNAKASPLSYGFGGGSELDVSAIYQTYSQQLIAVPLPATANMGLALLGCLGGLGAIRRMKLKKECELA